MRCQQLEPLRHLAAEPAKGSLPAPAAVALQATESGGQAGREKRHLQAVMSYHPAIASQVEAVVAPVG